MITKKNDLYYQLLLDSYYFYFDITIPDYLKVDYINKICLIFPHLIKDINNLYMKSYRIRKRINYIVDNFKYPIFITFTIKDDYIQNSTDFFENELKKVLKNYVYVFNRDYGSLNGRLHYHCILSDKFNPSLWKYGSVDFLSIKFKDVKKLSYYVLKLSHHTLKNLKVIYSRIKK